METQTKGKLALAGLVGLFIAAGVHLVKEEAYADEHSFIDTVTVNQVDFTYKDITITADDSLVINYRASSSIIRNLNLELREGKWMVFDGYRFGEDSLNTIKARAIHVLPTDYGSK